jgi:hypothetical protein
MLFLYSVLEQQVLDMLRDRLTDALSDLAASRSHVYEIQEAYAIDRRAVKDATNELTAAGQYPPLYPAKCLTRLFAGSRMADLASALKQQQRESLDVMTLAGDLEMQLDSSKVELVAISSLMAAVFAITLSFTGSPV